MAYLYLFYCIILLSPVHAVAFLKSKFVDNNAIRNVKMIDYSVLPMFLAACFILVVSPGPDLLLIGSYSSKQGVKSGAAVLFVVRAQVNTAMVYTWSAKCGPFTISK